MKIDLARLLTKHLTIVIHPERYTFSIILEQTLYSMCIVTGLYIVKSLCSMGNVKLLELVDETVTAFS